jgi:hypothetical protein
MTPPDYRSRFVYDVSTVIKEIAFDIDPPAPDIIGIIFIVLVDLLVLGVHHIKNDVLGLGVPLKGADDVLDPILLGIIVVKFPDFSLVLQLSFGDPHLSEVVNNIAFIVYEPPRFVYFS